MTDDRLLKVSEVAEWLGLHQNTVKRMSDRGEIPFYRLGTRGDRRYRASDVQAYLDGRVADNDRRRAAGHSA